MLSMKKIVLSSCAAAMLLSFTGANADDESCRGMTRHASPLGYDGMITFMATGVIDMNEPSPIPGVTGCAGMFCDGDYFHREISHRTDAEMAVMAQEAKDFFKMRFDLDIDDPAMEGRIAFIDFTLNPAFGYRAIAADYMRVPCDGYEVRDGGFAIVGMDPNGVDLGNELAGTRLNQGSMVVFGNYNIAVTNRRGRIVREDLVFYRSFIPLQPGADGSFLFRCEIRRDGEDWGNGQAMGQVANVVLDDGRIKSNAVNRLTFPILSTYDGF